MTFQIILGLRAVIFFARYRIIRRRDTVEPSGPPKNRRRHNNRRRDHRLNFRRRHGQTVVRLEELRVV